MNPNGGTTLSAGFEIGMSLFDSEKFNIRRVVMLTDMICKGNELKIQLENSAKN